MMEETLARVPRGAHLCHGYRRKRDEADAVVAFVRAGLAALHRCVIIADRARPDDVLADLAAADFPVPAATAAGALVVLPREGAYFHNGEFEPSRVLEWVRTQTEEALSRGFTGMHLVGEMTAVSGPYPGVERLAEYEARLDDLLPHLPASALCEYDRNRFGHDEMRELIMTHPLVIVDHSVCHNPLHVPPEDLLAGDWREREIDWLLESLRHMQVAEDCLRASEDRYRSLAQHLIDLQEAERRAIARELHDELGQALTAIRLNLQAARRASGERSAALVGESIGLVDDSIERVRTLALDLRPSILDDLGLAAGLRSLINRQAERAGLSARVDIEAFDRPLPAAVEIACFRVVQEALTNVARHSGAKRVEVRVALEGETLDCVVRDDGRGFDVEAARAHAQSLGLIGMEERVAIAGGSIHIASSPGRGTEISARFPLVAPRP